MDEADPGWLSGQHTNEGHSMYRKFGEDEALVINDTGEHEFHSEDPVLK